MPQEYRENFFTELLKFIALAAIIVVPLRLFVAQPFVVSGASMDPAFRNGQYLIVDELSYHVAAPQRGDVIIFRYPKDTSEFFIKRIVGLPGETVVVHNGAVEIRHVDGTTAALDEPYVVNQGNGADATYPVGDGEYFVMGDNRPESSDSRTWGLLPRTDIIGRAFLRLLPLNQIALLPGSVSRQ
jgi:signal peptidase I